jgi:hypothetical protein
VSTRLSTKKFVSGLKKLSFDSTCEHGFRITGLLLFNAAASVRGFIECLQQKLRKGHLALGFVFFAFHASCRLVLDIY